MRLVDMKRLIPILCVTLSLVACSGPDSSGGVALSKDQDRFVSVNGHLTCSEEPFRPGGNAMLRFYVVMDV